MVLWINGAFGSGKTTLANEICAKLKNSFLYDPENVGQLLRLNEPAIIQTKDFQDDILWRKINCLLLDHIYSTYNFTIVVPMTIINEQYYDEIIGTLRKNGTQVLDITLIVSKENIIKRLANRSGSSYTFPLLNLERCSEELKKDFYCNKIYNDNISIHELCEIVLQKMEDTGYKLDLK